VLLPSIIFFNQHYKAINKTDNSEREKQRRIYFLHTTNVRLFATIFD